MSVTPSFLRDIRRQAYRKRVWYRAIDDLERGIINLTVRVVEDVKSLTLIHVLESIVAKIRLACMSVYSRRHMEFGLGKAVLVVGQAVGFGSIVAEEWLVDTGFSRWLTLHHIYNPPWWGG